MLASRVISSKYIDTHCNIPNILQKLCPTIPLLPLSPTYQANTLTNNNKSNNSIADPTHSSHPSISQLFETELQNKLLVSPTKSSNLSSGLFEGCISVASDRASQQATLQLREEVPNIWGAFGIHPLYAGKNQQFQIIRIINFSGYYIWR